MPITPEQRLARVWNVAVRREIAITDRPNISDRVALAIALAYSYVAEMRWALVAVVDASGSGSVEIVDEANQRFAATFDPSEVPDIAAAHLEVVMAALGCWAQLEAEA